MNGSQIFDELIIIALVIMLIIGFVMVVSLVDNVLEDKFKISVLSTLKKGILINLVLLLYSIHVTGSDYNISFFQKAMIFIFITNFLLLAIVINKDKNFK